MNIVDILTTLYPEEWQQGLFSFKDDGEGIVIDAWNMPIPQPTNEQIMAYIDSILNQFNVNAFVQAGTPLLTKFIDDTAKAKGYDTTMSCISYVSSNNTTWKSEALAFGAWRDNVFAYVIAQTELMKNSSRTIPTFDEFKLELPLITW